MRLAFLAIAVITLFTETAFSQIGRPWTEWSKKDAEKILNDSAWGQTQTIGGGESPSTSAITKTEGAGREDVNRSGESGESLGGTKSINIRGRFLTAKPVREAFARLVVLAQPNAGKELVDQLQGFIDRDFGNYLVVTVSVDGSDPKIAGASMALLSKLNKESLKDKVYIERKDGKRLSLIDYKPPINDGMGAKFIFERSVDGEPFLSNNSDTVRFYFEASEKMKINLRFKVAAMVYDGKLEY
jgi:hypothetical protein